MVVRRWSRDTLLNGLAFADAELTRGDRLSIGAIELEVVESGNAPGSEVSEVRRTRGESLAEPPRAPQPQPLEETFTRLQAEIESLQEQRRRVDTQQEELLRKREQWEADRAESEKQLEQRTGEIIARWTKLDGQRQALEEERRQWEAERTEAERQLSQRSRELDAGWSDLDARRATLEEEHRRWEARRVEREQQPDEPAADSEPPQQSSAAPVDLQEVLHKIGSVDLLEDAPREESVESFPPEPPPPESPPSESPRPEPTTTGIQSPPTAQPVENEEESIDDYMVRLMQRVRSITEGEGKSSSVGTSPQPDEQADPEGSSVAPPTPSSPPTESGPPREPQRMSPRAVAPERSVDLTAMRELANLSAKTAIDRHSRHKKIHGSRSKLLISFAAATLGATMLGIWRMTDVGQTSYYVALACFVLAALWAVPYALTVCRNITTRPARSRRPSAAETTATGSPNAPVEDFEPSTDADERTSRSEESV